MQVILVGMICFCCPGMFNALSGMGGGGQVDPTIANQANAALYACFAVFSFFASSFHNALGPRLCLCLGGLTYALYSGALLNYNINATGSLVIVAGAILGIGAALLWTAQGAIMLSYPTENEKGKYIATFWIIFNLGGVLGGFIPFSINFNSSASSVNNATYIAFTILMLMGSVYALFIRSPSTIYKSDGSKVIYPEPVSTMVELGRFKEALMDRNILFLLPSFIASNFFYAYQFNSVNGSLFNIRTRGLNNVYYWAMQMIGAFVFGKFVLDKPNVSRQMRGYFGLFIIATISTITWDMGTYLQFTMSPDHSIDFTDSRKALFPTLVYCLYGLLDAIYQNYIYWLIGSLSNDSSVIARYVGAYKAFQSAGGAMAWQLDAVGTSYNIQVLVSWGLMLISLPFMYVTARKLER
ncbi:major facilitator superfamily domain-containing protein [Globomyces pollinis-pini]|nr:major facilitator superfamily domain-containing protein [Globomyces pollinis-pini]